MDTTAAPTFTPGTIVNTGNGDYVWTFEVVKRTAKFVTLRDVDTGDVRRVGIRTDSVDGGEWALPLGTYSMAPAVRPDRIAA